VCNQSTDELSSSFQKYLSLMIVGLFGHSRSVFQSEDGLFLLEDERKVARLTSVESHLCDSSCQATIHHQNFMYASACRPARESVKSSFDCFIVLLLSLGAALSYFRFVFAIHHNYIDAGNNGCEG